MTHRRTPLTDLNFTPEQWSLQEKVKRLKLLAPERAKGLDKLLTGILQEVWPQPSAAARKVREGDDPSVTKPKGGA